VQSAKLEFYDTSDKNGYKMKETGPRLRLKTELSVIYCHFSVIMFFHSNAFSFFHLFISLVNISPAYCTPAYKYNPYKYIKQYSRLFYFYIRIRVERRVHTCLIIKCFFIRDNEINRRPRVRGKSAPL